MKTSSPSRGPTNNSLSPSAAAHNKGKAVATNTLRKQLVSEGTTTNLPPKEILYFDIETTITEISTQVLQKYISQAQRNEERFDQIKEENLKILRRFQEMDFIMHKTLQRSGNISDLQQEMLEVKQMFQVVETKVTQNIADMHLKLQNQSERLSISEEHLFHYDREVQRFKSSTQDFMDKNLRLKSEIENHVLQVKREMLEEVGNLNMKILKQNQAVSQHGGAIESHLQELRRHELMLDVYKRNIKELYDSEMSLHSKKLDSDHFTHSFDQFRRDFDLLRSQLDDNQLTLSQTDNYLEKYLPIKIQNYITETLTNILPKRALGKLNDYIRHKYRVLREVADRDDGKPKLNKIEVNIPIIKKIELMMQRDLTRGLMRHNLSRMEQSVGHSRSNEEESFFEEGDSSKHLTRENRTHTDNQESQSSRVRQEFANNTEDNKSISTISRNQKETNSDKQHETQNSGVKKRNFLVYYPGLSQDQHKEIINIRFDPKSNLVPVNSQSQQNLNQILSGAAASQDIIEPPPPLTSLDDHQQQATMQLTSENLRQLEKRQSQPLVETSTEQLSQQPRKELTPTHLQRKRPVASPRRMTQIQIIPPSTTTTTAQAHPSNRSPEHHKRPSYNIIKVEMAAEDSQGTGLSPPRKGGNSKYKNDSMRHSRQMKRNGDTIYEQDQDDEGGSEDDDSADDDDYGDQKLSVSSSDSGKKLIKLSDLNDDLSEMILEAYELTKQYKNNIDHGVEKVREAEGLAMSTVERVSQDLNTQFTKELTRLQIFSSNIQRDFEDEFKNKQRDKSDLELKLRSMKDSIDGNKHQFQVLEQQSQSLQNFVKNLAEILKAVINLGQQDEDDRRSVSLYGYKVSESEKTTDKNLFTIDRQCLGCSGQQSIIINAFKMACLSYQPQPIQFKGEIMSRETLYSLTSQQLESSYSRFLNGTSLQDHHLTNYLENYRSHPALEQPMFRSNTNQSHNTISTLNDEPGTNTHHQNQHMIDRGVTNINIHNIDIKAKVLNMDHLTQSNALSYSNKVTQLQQSSTRAQTTSRAGARNIQMSLYQTYQSQASANGSGNAERPQTMQEPRVILKSSMSQRSLNTNFNKQDSKDSLPQVTESKRLFNNIVKERFGSGSGKIKILAQTPREIGSTSQTFHIRIPQTTRNNNMLIKHEDGDNNTTGEYTGFGIQSIEVKKEKKPQTAATALGKRMKADKQQ